mmetsp:Transcript_25340/g.73339  ORF Transcript_25340/g.73339 Transcript_25340/m.73339 type:complete len:378 (-) Transcript_25340:37-1170(-)
MGRVSKYKKIKAVDPFSKKKKGKAAASSRTSNYVWGTGDNGRREKKRSVKAQRHQARKLEGSSMSDGRRRAREAAGAGGFDLPPTGKDDFDLADLMGSVRRQKRPRIDDGLADHRRRTETVSTKSKGGNTAAAAAAAGGGGVTQPTPSIPETDAEEKRVARILKLSKDSKGGGSAGAGGKGGSGKSAAGSSSATSKSQLSGRREGESMRAFERRVKEETRLILLEQASESKLMSKEKAAKKKEFLKSLKSKKKNRKGGGGGVGRPRSGSSGDEYGSDGGYGNDGGGGFVTGERAVAAAARAASYTGAAIHDQVERPPTFELLPRGATKKVKKEGGKLGMDEQKRRAEQRAMDNLRSKVQAQYAVIKQKRKRAGDFHL